MIRDLPNDGSRENRVTRKRASHGSREMARIEIKEIPATVTETVLVTLVTIGRGCLRDQIALETIGSHDYLRALAMPTVPS